MGSIATEEMYRVFNMGIGFVLIVEENAAEKVMGTLQEMAEEFFIIGKVIKGAGLATLNRGWMPEVGNY